MDAPSNISLNETEETKLKFKELLAELEKLSEQLGHELDGKVSRQRVCEVVAETAAEFCGASVTKYVSLLVRRRVKERLAQEISRVKPDSQFDKENGERQRP
jgi:hypothetical protein